MNINRIKELVANIKEEAIATRRYLHKYPELSFKEFKTSAYIKSILEQENLSFEEVANTGILVKIVGTKSESSDCILLRADIDALPIQEVNGTAFDSVNSNVMHACGHDFHTANLLSVLKLLSNLKHEFSGTVLGVFQPAEEKIPGGAKAVLESGILSDYVIKAVLGLHVSPKYPVGNVAIRAGKFMASSDELFVTITGKGGHGAQPHLNIDPVLIASQLVVSLQQIVSRVANPAIPSVLSIGKFIANGATNVIPNEVYLEGTFRTMDEEWRDRALSLIEKQIKELPALYGAKVELEIRRGYPALINDIELTNVVANLLREYHGFESVHEADIWMAAEDFAYYTKSYPSTFYLIGIANTSKGIVSELHTPTFQIDEDAFDQAIGSMIYSALRLLNK
ncbi:M20 metallopeptidase family protein [Sphingobacterium bovistauri]|uniref:Amidohydrolase n=1 Tax=Sphingobacterium bovistauri TaxID=2781959 RepID=A0ABS7Z5N3_9SPHI|nr:M20 family metallopeptidase [Sphingobacterium bovistauri]MCA5005465.1 amidohydrolase [Sphingobacterium bovistauri]